MEVVSLTEVVRQAGSNPVNDMISISREDALNNTDKFKDYIEETNVSNPSNLRFSEDGIEEGYILSKDGSSIKDKLYTLFSTSTALYDYKFVKIVAYRNAKVKQYNKLIKGIINPSPLPLSKDDWMLGYSPFKREKKILTQNGRYYKVMSASLFPVTYNRETYDTIKCVLSYSERNNNGELETKSVSISFLHPDSYEKFRLVLTKVWQDGINMRRWKPYYALLANFALLDDFDFVSVDSRGNAKTQSMAKKNMDLGYAITVHRSQGSTFNNVYIDYEDFARCFEPTTRRRLTYVAVSRTRNINMIYG